MQLEARLGVRLLQRTTRHVSPTLDGEAYHRRCLALIADLEDAGAGFSGAKPRGLLRVDLLGTLARHFLLPALPAFLARYPDLQSISAKATGWPISSATASIACFPRYHLKADLASGSLVEVLKDYPPSPTPVSALYPQSRQLSPRVRVFIDWLASEFAARTGVASGGNRVG